MLVTVAGLEDVADDPDEEVEVAVELELLEVKLSSFPPDEAMVTDLLVALAPAA